jgi:cell division protein FtsN
MAKEEKKAVKRGATKKTEARSPLPGWLWLVTGLAVGLFVAFLVFLQGQPDKVETESTALPDKTTKPTTKETKDQDSFSYDFYKLLPNMEVLVPDKKDKDSQDIVAPVNAEGTYLLQAGSFRKYEDADRRKASLALLGIRSRIVKVTIDDTHVWHRVHVGPFSDLNELNEVRQALFDQKIDTLVIRIKG